MQDGKFQHTVPLTSAAVPFDDSDEGGLDVGLAIGAIRRRILLVLGMAVAWQHCLPAVA
ncbi:MAG: hypothetical protein HC925_01930 [Coleofasciculaceae cyanobacterium SM2_3_26]|nr:hypothetical protein [Coleofasciculaceae cyanobacterium SM2_3_26]